jgi:hypothetical protein
MADEKKFDKCPVCQSPVKCVGKYATVYVYQCTGAKCRRKWNKDALESKKHETTKHNTKK